MKVASRVSKLLIALCITLNGLFVIAIQPTTAVTAVTEDLPWSNISDQHPKVWLNDAAIMQDLRDKLNSGDPKAVRFKNMVDSKLNGTNDPYQFQSHYAALMYQLTGDIRYGNLAVQLWDAELNAEEAQMNDRGYPEIAGDSYLNASHILKDGNLTYDWAYDLLSDSQKQRWIALANQAVFNIWNPSQAEWGGKPLPWSGWGTDQPGNNYYMSHLQATLYTGLATYGDNPEADSILNNFRFTRVENVLAPYVNDYLQGGFAREGTAYSNTIIRAFPQMMEVWKSTTGEDMSGLFGDYFEYSLVHQMHYIVPTRDRRNYDGDQPRSSFAEYYDYDRATTLGLTKMFKNDRIGQVGQYFLDNSPLQQMNHTPSLFDDFVNYNPQGEEAPLSDLNTTYYAPGTGFVYMRSSWDQLDATYASFKVPPITESHNNDDPGSLLIYKNGWLASTGNEFANSGLVQDVEYQNVVRLSKDGAVIRPRGERGGAIAGHISALEDNSYYTYASGDLSYIYLSPDVRENSREVVYIKPDVFVVRDHIETKESANVEKRWQLVVPSASFTGKTATVDNNGQKLTVANILPANGSFSSTSLKTENADFLGGTRLEMIDNPTDGKTQFLNVMYVNDSVASYTEDHVDGMKGVRLQLKDGSEATVRFHDNGGGTILIKDASGHVVRDSLLTETVQVPPVFADGTSLSPLTLPAKPETEANEPNKLPITLYSEVEHGFFTPSFGSTAAIVAGQGINGSHAIEYAELDLYDQTAFLLMPKAVDIRHLPSNSFLQISADFGETSQSGRQFLITFNDNSWANGVSVLSPPMDQTAGYQTFFIPISDIRSRLGDEITKFNFSGYGTWLDNTRLLIDDIKFVAGEFDSVCSCYLPFFDGGTGIKTFVNGESMTFAVPPVVKSGRVLIPFRAVAEKLNAELTWIDEGQMVILTREGFEVKLVIGSSIAFVNGQEVTLDVPAEINNGNTLVSLRFLVEALGATVDYDNDTKTINIAATPSSGDGGFPAYANPVEPGVSQNQAFARIKSPAQHMRFTEGQPIRILADANDPNGWQWLSTRSQAAEVQFFVDGELVDTKGQHPDEINKFETTVNGLEPGMHVLTVKSRNFGDVILDGLVPVYIMVDPMPEKSTTLNLTEDLILTGADNLDLVDTVVIGNGHRIKSSPDWSGSVHIANSFITGLGSYDSNGIDLITSAGNVTIQSSIFEATGALSLQVNGSGFVKVTGNEFRANNFIQYVAWDPNRSPVIEFRGSTTGDKRFSGNKIGGGIVSFTHMDNWLIGGDTDADGNIFMGPRAVLTLDHSNNAVIRGNYLYHDYNGGWSQGFNMRFDGTSGGALAEHNVVKNGSWLVQSFGGEFRYNLVVNSGHNWIRSAKSGSSFHHNLLIHTNGTDTNFIGGMLFYEPSEDISIENNTFDAGGAFSNYNAPVLTIGQEAHLQSFSSNIITNLSNTLGTYSHSLVSHNADESGVSEPRIDKADYNLFFNPLANESSNYYSGIVFGAAGAHDQNTDPLFAEGAANPYPITDGDIWDRTMSVSEVLSSYRDRYAPKAGSPLIDAGDPAGGTGNDIGAVGAGIPNENDKFGRFTN